MNFLRFFGLLIQLENAKNEICKICHYSSNMAAIRLEIRQKRFQVKRFQLIDEKFYTFLGQFLHGNPAMPFEFQNSQFRKENDIHFHDARQTNDYNKNFVYQRIIKWILFPRAGQTNPFSDHLVEKKSCGTWDTSLIFHTYNRFQILLLPTLIVVE